MKSLLAFCSAMVLLIATAGKTYALQEAPMLTKLVEEGELPSVQQRLPDTPLIVNLSVPYQIGQYGGQLRMLMGKPKDIRMAMVYGYARLVGYNTDFELVPDILEKIDIEDNRVFTLHLRPGHRWSDGAAFTAEDFRYYWEDMANNSELSKSGIPKQLLVNQQAPRFEVLSPHIVRYSWSEPNPYFLPALAGARPLMIYRAAHYLKQFHVKYADPTILEEMVETAGKRNWTSLHVAKDRWYRFDNPERPTLQPWFNTVAPPSERFVFKRNPYFHRIDQAGNQLPYIDELVFNIASASLIPAKAGTGESDLQARYLRLDNYTFLKSGEQRNGYSVKLWRSGTGSQIALYPNLNTNDETWRHLLQDVRFRRALSLGIHRHEINQVIYFGLVKESSNTILDKSPLYQSEFASRWAEFDIDQANQLLDEIGLTQRDEKGLRKLPDDRSIEIIVQTAGESSEQADVLELIHDSWLKLGVKLHTRPSQREIFRSRTFSGDTLMGVWWGVDNGLVSPNSSPEEFVPSSQQQLQWPKWGQYIESGGIKGQPSEMEDVNRLVVLNRQWEQAQDAKTQKLVWHKILDQYSDQVYSIGTINSVPQPIVISNRLHNVPKEGIYTWEPSSYFGVYRPDTFYFADE